MSIGHCFWTVLLSGFLLTDGVWGYFASTNIDCKTPMPYWFPEFSEGYSDGLERVSTPPETLLKLESPSCPVCLSFLNLIQSPDGTFALVGTTKPLDAEALIEYNGTFTYSIVCMNGGVKNNRTLVVNDINDNPPVFEKDMYEVQVSKSLPVGGLVVQVKATDADVSPPYNTIKYISKLHSDTFEVTSDGSILLKKQLIPENRGYYLMVFAEDCCGFSDMTDVMISITVVYFEYKEYIATITECELGPLQDMGPAPIKANDEQNRTIIYNISSVHPIEYWANFAIDSRTGVITVQKELDYETTSSVVLHIKASVKNYSETTAMTSVLVKVENVNEPPFFSHQVYVAEIVSVVAVGWSVVVVQATDPDEGENERLQYSLVEPSSQFAVEPSSGQVYVVSDIHSCTETLKVRATDPHGLYATTVVQVTIKDSSNVVQISINKPSDTVEDKVREIEEALGRALGFNVTIVRVASSTSGSTVVTFIATETSGNIVSPEDVKNDLEEKKETVQKELQEVFGSDTDFEIVDDGGTDSNVNIIAIVLGIVIPMTVIAAIIAGVFGVRRKRQPDTNRRKSEMSIDYPPKF